ncbi:MAG: response regulator [Cyanosarcina radialis HA8281-LM2]|jgi:PAS domain S-box-containing protein|nr:response regulator [Cyanosarcina radialis HA8281-LM2]
MARPLEPDSFNRQIEAAQDRFDRLKRLADKFPWSQNELLAESVEELSTALEELRVAAEEMQEQHEQIIESQEVIEAERQKYIDLFEFAPNGYVVSDIHGHIQAANQAAVSLLGMPRDRLMGKLLVTFVSPEDRKKFRTKLNQIQKNPQSVKSWECSLQQHRGASIFCEIAVSRIDEDREQSIGLRWLIQDATERQLLAEMETANRIKDEFLAIVSHELRTPLNPILGWSAMLRKGRLDPTKTAYAVEAIERNAKIQAQLIEDLLDVSRILRGKFSLNQSPVNAIAVIKAALETVQLAAEAKKIELKFEVINEEEPGDKGDISSSPSPHLPIPPSPHPPSPSPYILGDFSRLQQVIWNLLSNAIKFTPQGGRVEVKLSTIAHRSSSRESEPLTTKYAQIEVSDTGIGIAPDFLPYVFEYFRQADSSSSRESGGLGLGLAIVRHLVELHGGKVRVDSLGKGQGATFTVRLPLLDRLVDKEGKEDCPLLPASLTGLRVLVVDDDLDNLNLTALTLEQSGASVQKATSATEALQAFEQTEFDLLLSDIGMPGMDGYTLLERIRSIPSESKEPIPAIALTSYAGETNQRQAIAAGFQLHISKPVLPTELIERIADVARSNSN